MYTISVCHLVTANYNTLMYTIIFVVNTLWQRQESMDQLWLKPLQGIKEESTIKSFETFVQTKVQALQYSNWLQKKLPVCFK